MIQRADATSVQEHATVMGKSVVDALKDHLIDGDISIVTA